MDSSRCSPLKHYVHSKRRKPLTQWGGVISRENDAAVISWKLATGHYSVVPHYLPKSLDTHSNKLLFTRDAEVQRAAGAKPNCSAVFPGLVYSTNICYLGILATPWERCTFTKIVDLSVCQWLSANVAHVKVGHYTIIQMWSPHVTLRSSETSVANHPTTQCHIPQHQRCENLVSHIRHATWQAPRHHQFRPCRQTQEVHSLCALVHLHVWRHAPTAVFTLFMTRQPVTLLEACGNPGFIALTLEAGRHRPQTRCGYFCRSADMPNEKKPWKGQIGCVKN
jgi:hypothetical protein